MDELRALRRSRSLSQRGLSSMSGVAQDTISDLERRARHPQPATIRKLAGALGVSVSEIVVAETSARRDLPAPSEVGRGFVVRGRILGRQSEIGWRAGELFGEEGVVEYVYGEADRLEGRLAGPEERPMIFEGQRSLYEALDAYLFLTHQIFEEVSVVDGRIPSRDPLPSGSLT